jgi:hypothetical protein
MERTGVCSISNHAVLSLSLGRKSFFFWPDSNLLTQANVASMVFCSIVLILSSMREVVWLVRFSISRRVVMLAADRGRRTAWMHITINVVILIVVRAEKR